MINRYLDFLTESLILESNVVYSDDFRNILNKVDSPISKSLLDIENNDLNVQSNFFDINKEKNDEISFIPDRKAQELVGGTDEFVTFLGGDGGWLRHTEPNADIFGKLGYQFEQPEPFKPSSGQTGKVVKRVVSDTSGNTYVWVKFFDDDGNELGEGVYNEQKLRNIEDPKRKQVWSTNRQKTKVGRGIRALLKLAGVDFLDKDIEDFVNKWKSTIDRLNDKFRLFEVVDGDMISHWYKYSNYYANSGPLGSSCMKSVPSDYFQIYTKNPEVCKLVILKSEENDTKITARALLWTLTDGKKFLDRVYFIKDSDLQLYREWAKENGIYAKYHNSSTDSGRCYDPNGEVVDIPLRVQLSKEEDYDRFPYVDTIKYFDSDSCLLSNSKKWGDLTLESTGGDAISCESCGGSGMVTCYQCDGYGTSECRRCDGDGEEDCDECSGDGQVECGTCDGTGSIDDGDGGEETCKDCDGDGKVSCGDCDGRGRVACSRCDGDGRWDCGECDGRGEYSCSDCG